MEIESSPADVLVYLICIRLEMCIIIHANNDITSTVNLCIITNLPYKDQPAHPII